LFVIVALEDRAVRVRDDADRVVPRWTRGPGDERGARPTGTGDEPEDLVAVDAVPDRWGAVVEPDPDLACVPRADVVDQHADRRGRAGRHGSGRVEGNVARVQGEIREDRWMAGPSFAMNASSSVVGVESNAPGVTGKSAP